MRSLTLYLALLGQAWNILGGFGGQFSFGHAVFFGTGAYAMAVLQVKLGLNAWVAMPVALAVGAAVGALVGALSFRYGLRGSYFALVTLAFAEVFRILANTFQFTGAGVGMHDPAARAPPTCSSRAARAFSTSILALCVAGARRPVARALALRRLAAGGARQRGVRGGAGGQRLPGQARRDHDFGRAHGGGRRLLLAVPALRRPAHRVRAGDLGRGAARPDRRRHGHGVRAAARRGRAARASARARATCWATHPGVSLVALRRGADRDAALPPARADRPSVAGPPAVDGCRGGLSSVSEAWRRGRSRWPWTAPDRRPDRTQRRRQDDAVRPASRASCTRSRTVAFDGARHHRPAAAPHLPSRPGAHVPDRPAVRRADRAREHRRRRASVSRAGGRPRSTRRRASPPRGPGARSSTSRRRI